MYTQEEWSLYEDMQDELNEFGEKYIDTFFTGGRGNYFFERATIEGDYITIHYEWSCMGGHEDEDVTIPLHYLWTEDWIELEKARLEEVRIAREKAEHQRLIDKRNKEIAEEKVKYLELQKKYGDTK